MPGITLTGHRYNTGGRNAGKVSLNFNAIHGNRFIYLHIDTGSGLTSISISKDAFKMLMEWASTNIT